MEPAARRQNILAAIVESYIATGEPVGSKSLISETGMNVSSATVRNDMVELTNRGYIVQPHTSAGRIPTAQGYRYYVDNVMQVKPISGQGRQYIRHLRFIQTGAHSAMAVLIASNGTIKTKLFRCEFLITPELMGIFDKAFNEIFTGVKLSSVNRPFIQTAAVRFGEMSLLMPSALMAVQDAAEQATTVSVYQSGRGKLAFSEDADFRSARRIIEFLNSPHDLAATLEKSPQHTAALIGRENSRVELANYSLISARYKIDGSPSGVTALITPLRTDYARNFALLECVADCAGELIDELTDIKRE